RLWGGNVGPTAQSYVAPITLNSAAFIRARTRNGTNWSALVDNAFYVVQDFSGLTVTEIMYHPPAGLYPGDDYEFIELKNTGATTLDLSGLQFTEGLTFAFTHGPRLAPGAFFVLARSAVAFASLHPGVTINGLCSGRLDNGGEKLT